MKTEMTVSAGDVAYVTSILRTLVVTSDSIIKDEATEAAVLRVLQALDEADRIVID